ncbi:hypothetical protein C817_01191 [Dorea sp. 5-2]|nr:hypothetical protein C817_01191 [Dorea sp. 5-2]
MDRSQWYIGTPNGAVLCVDRAGENQFTGRLYHAYSRERVEIEGIGHLLFELERFFDSINFPHVSTNERTFREARQAAEPAGKMIEGKARKEEEKEEGNVREEEKGEGKASEAMKGEGKTGKASEEMKGNGESKPERILSDEELLKKHGDLGTFIIRVQQRQNSSWQGRITWMDKDETIYFRSVWEMIKLIASALDKVGGQEGEGSRDMTWSQED